MFDNKQVKKERDPLSCPKINFISHLCAFAVITLVGIAIYGHTLDYEFHFDDFYNIHKNSEIKDLANFKKLSAWKSFNRRPVVYFTLALNYHLHGLDVTGYHIVNIAIHVLMGWAVYLLVNLIGRITDQDRTIFSISLNYFAVLTALICVAHPLQIQAVTYIIQRTAALAALFFIVSVYFYAKGRWNHVRNGVSLSTFLYYLLAIAFGIIALFTKQNAATFPLAFLLFELCFIRKPDGRLCRKYIITSSAILFIGFLVILILGKLPAGDGKNLSRGDYLIAQFCVIAKYFRLLILPVGQNLDHDVLAPTSLWNIWALASLALISLIIIAGIRLFPKNKILSFGILWFFVTLIVESTIIPINDIIFEHRLYLPMLGFSLFLVEYSCLTFSRKNRIVPIIILSLITTSYCIATVRRNLIWETENSLWTDVLAKSPRKFRPLYTLGILHKRKNEIDIALDYFERAYKADPTDTKNLNHLGSIWKNKGNLDKGIRYLTEAHNLEPFETDVLFNLGNAWRNRDNETAVRYYEKVIAIKPKYIDALNNLGTLYKNLNRFEEARRCFQRILETNPKFHIASFNLANLESSVKDYGAAARNFEHYLTLKPDSKAALENLGYAYIQLKRYSDAEGIYRKLTSMIPVSPSSYVNLLTVYDLRKDYEKAYPVAVEAEKLFPDNKQIRSNVNTILRKYEGISPTGESADESQ